MKSRLFLLFVVIALAIPFYLVILRRWIPAEENKTSAIPKSRDSPEEGDTLEKSDAPKGSPLPVATAPAQVNSPAEKPAQENPNASLEISIKNYFFAPFNASIRARATAPIDFVRGDLISAQMNLDGVPVEGADFKAERTASGAFNLISGVFPPVSPSLPIFPAVSPESSKLALAEVAKTRPSLTFYRKLWVPGSTPSDLRPVHEFIVNSQDRVSGRNKKEIWQFDLASKAILKKYEPVRH